MATKKKSKKTPKPEPTSPTSPEHQPPGESGLQVLSAAEHDLGPWPNRRALALCPVCQQEHQAPITYAARVLKRGNPTPEEIAWLQSHLAGIQLEA